MRSLWRTPDRDIVLACLAVWLFGLSYGAVAVTDVLPAWLPAAASLLVIAGSAELLFVGVVAAGGSPVAAALAGLLVNARHLPYGLALPSGVLGRGWRRALGTHLMNDESVVFALASPPRDATRRYWQCGYGVLLCWPAGAIMGALAGSFVHDTGALGLDAVFPAVIVALVLPQLRESTARVGAALGGAGVALLAAPFLPAGMPVLLALVAAVPVVVLGVR